MQFPKFPQLTQLSGRITQIPYPVRVTALSVTTTLALIGLLAAIFRRRRSKKYDKDKHKRQEIVRDKSGRIPLPYSPNGDLPYRSRSPSSVRSLIRQKSLYGSQGSLGAVSTSTTSTIIHPSVDTTDMTPQQLCKLGLETLQVAVTYWEDAVMKMGYLDDNPLPAITDPDTAALQHHLEHLLEMAYHMQDSYERQCERQADHMVFDTAIQAFTETEQTMKASSRTMSIGSSSDLDSFVSATDLADLSDLDTHRDMFKHLPLYEAGLMELKYGSVSCRTLRTEMSHCLSDTEFLAKLHCIRLGLEEVFQKPDHREYFADVGKQIIGNLLIHADKDPEDFYTSYSAMLDFVNNCENFTNMEEELRGRGVKNFTFYDVVLDFILMDAFDDLENPPSSVIAVVNNRWLSNGFKETALSTAVWSVLKAKRRMLKADMTSEVNMIMRDLTDLLGTNQNPHSANVYYEFPDGFISHFYCIAEVVSPVLAWGFLGPESKLKHICTNFKEIILDFIRDMFSFERTRYTTVDDLASDIVKLAKERSQEALQRLQLEPT